MALNATRNVSDGVVTYQITGSGLIANVDPILENGLRYVYPVRYQLYDGNGDPIPFDSLTLNQKLVMFAKETWYYWRELARAYHRKAGAAAGGEAADAESESWIVEE